MPRGKKHTAEQIIGQLREAAVSCGNSAGRHRFHAPCQQDRCSVVPRTLWGGSVATKRVAEKCIDQGVDEPMRGTETVTAARDFEVGHACRGIRVAEESACDAFALGVRDGSPWETASVRPGIR